jgi:hypothetical protein
MQAISFFWIYASWSLNINQEYTKYKRVIGVWNIEISIPTFCALLVQQHQESPARMSWRAPAAVVPAGCCTPAWGMPALAAVSVPWASTCSSALPAGPSLLPHTRTCRRTSGPRDRQSVATRACRRPQCCCSSAPRGRRTLAGASSRRPPPHTRQMRRRRL